MFVVVCRPLAIVYGLAFMRRHEKHLACLISVYRAGELMCNFVAPQSFCLLPSRFPIRCACLDVLINPSTRQLKHALAANATPHEAVVRLLPERTLRYSSAAVPCNPWPGL